MALEDPYLEDPYPDLVGFPPPSWGQPEQISSVDYGLVNAGNAVVNPTPPPPPPPPPPQRIGAAAGMQGEIAQPALPPPDTSLTPEEAAQIEIDQPAAAPPGGMQEAMYGVPAAPGMPGAGMTPDEDLAARHQAFLNAAGEGRTEGTSKQEEARADSQQSAELAGNPYELARQDVAAERAKQAEQNKRQSEIDIDNDRTALANRNAHIAAVAKVRADSDQIQADAAKLATQKIDPKLHEGILGTIGDIIAGAIGGAASKYTGGRNLPLEALNQKIQEHIDTQKANRENQWRGLDTRRMGNVEQAARAADDFRDEETFRQATYQRALNGLSTKMQDFDSRGTAVRQLAHTYQQIASGAQQSQGAYDQKNLDNWLKVAGVSQKQDEIDEARRKNMAEEAAKAAKLAGTGKPIVPVFGTTYKSINDIDPKHQDFAFSLPGGVFAVANNKQNAEDLEHLGKSYKQINYDLNELQRMSLERNGQKSAGGQLLKKWEDTNEQHYDQVATDFLQQYALIVHGRSPTKGVIEDITKSGNVGLKGALDRGDTTELLGKFHDDIDNRTLEQLQPFAGEGYKLPNDRPYLNEENVNTRKAWMVADPVKGAAGYGRFDVRNLAQGLNADVAEYMQNPGLGGNQNLSKDLDDKAAAQRKAASVIRDDIAKLQSKKTLTAQERQQLTNNRQALKDREQAVRTVEEMRNKNIEQLRAAEGRQKAKEELHKAIETRGVEH